MEPLHNFHVPVMGTGFTADTPLQIARFGISSVVSLVDDELLHAVHRHHAKRMGREVESIDGATPGDRERRIRAYLDFLDAEVGAQVEHLKTMRFDPGTELTRYFELLPDGELRRAWVDMLADPDPTTRAERQDALRQAVVPGSIDVNIMTKVDRELTPQGEPRGPGASDAVTALRGFANSTVRGAVVFSAGLNPRLFAEAAELDAFAPDAAGELHKRIILKVSDFRSARIQGKYLAKRGLWVSEFRFESGLNCGGHAFPSESQLLGPALAQMRDQREALQAELWETYLGARPEMAGRSPYPLRIGAQGGIGNADEQALLCEHFGVDSVGWGTPFLFVPEVTRVDDETRHALAQAGPAQIRLGHGSPLGVRFWMLTTSASERARLRRIRLGRPGSSCPKGFLGKNTPYTRVPACLAARHYQSRRLRALESDELVPGRVRTRELVVEKACICHELGGGIGKVLGFDRGIDACICPGPNAAHYGGEATLDEMVAHIYGRGAVAMREGRRHALVAELHLYVDLLEEGESEDTSPSRLRKIRLAVDQACSDYEALADRVPGLAEQLQDVRGRLLALDAAGASARTA